MGKRLDQTLQTKENLKTAFWDLYREKPLDQITVKEVTDLAGYNRGTFYVYYRDVYDVLEQTEREILSIFESDTPFEFTPSDREHFEKNISFFIQFFEQHHQYIVLLAGERGDPKFMRHLRDSIEQSVAVRLRPYSQLDDPSYSYMVDALIASEAALIMRWFLTEKELPFERLVDLLYNLLFYGTLELIVHGTREEGTFPKP